LESNLDCGIVIPFRMNSCKTVTKAGLIARLQGLEAQSAAAAAAHRATMSTQRKRARTALADRGERLRAILETAVEGIITMDERGVVESVNPAAEKIFGYRAREIVGGNVNVLMPSPDQEHHDGYLENYRRTGHAKIIGIGREVSGRRKDGTIFPMDLSVSEVQLARRRLFTGFIRDITGRKDAEKALQHQAAIIDSSDDAIIGKTLPGVITSWNHGAEKIFGYTRNEALGKNISILVPPNRADEEPAIIERIRRGEAVDHYETVRRRKNGRLIDISVTISPIREPDGKIVGASKVARDITQRKQLEREILEISDREQRRIGQDLHDGLCQQLAGIELMSRALEQRLAAKSKTDAASAGEIAGHVRDAIGHTRLLARGLSPVTLESEGLMAGLQELAANTEKIFRVGCRFKCASPVPVKDSAVATHLFRIAQEAVSNAVKHGKATQVLIQLHAEPRGKIVLRVNDNGGGFPPTPPRQKGMGLQIMQSRAGMIGGTLAVANHAGGGASIVCSVALNGAAKHTAGSRGRHKEKHQIQKMDSHR
jgi:PAS domain S-box-containing protein